METCLLYLKTLWEYAVRGNPVCSNELKRVSMKLWRDKVPVIMKIIAERGEEKAKGNF